MDIEELKKIVRGNGFQESHGSTTMVVDVETVIDLLDELKQCDIHVVMQKKFTKYFKLYKKVKAELDHYINMRGSSFGVGVGKDEYAVKWQNKQMRLEILEAFLEGRTPNWYFAYYLNNEERDRRNQIYCA